MELKDVVVVSAVRTPMGNFGGSLREMQVFEIGKHAIQESIQRAGIAGTDIDEVLYGNTRQAGNGPNPARTAALRAGIPPSAHATTINNACPSSMKAMILAAQMIRLDQAGIVLVGGMESMSTIPYLLKGSRWEGFRMGDKVLQDGWGDSVDPVVGYGMGMTAENLVDKYKISREEMDAFALGSQEKAAQAQDKGWFNEEITPVEVPGYRKAPGFRFTRDESIRRDTSLEALGALRPAFKKDGSVTAGNACGMTDGACAAVMMSRDRAKSLGQKPLFSLVSHASVGVDNAVMGEGPAVSIPEALRRVGMGLEDMDLIEVNEAFAAQMLANERVLGWDRDKVNVHGGAIALGHPTGCSGARIVITLYHALKRLDRETGVAGICGGGGVSCAVMIRRES
jgi:acetyl-CoA C-acetyltransferase